MCIFYLIQTYVIIFLYFTQLIQLFLKTIYLFYSFDNFKAKKATTHLEWWLSPYTYSYMNIYKHLVMCA